MKNRRLHINQLFAAFLLWVFAIALTPWSSFHHHEEEVYCTKTGVVCMHKTHIGSQVHNCLICSAHFEKVYHASEYHFLVKLESKPVANNPVLTGGTYTALISQSLRGPPLA